MKRRQTDKLNVTLPTLPPDQVLVVTDWLFALAHELELYYADEIRSRRQGSRHEADDEYGSDGGSDPPF